MKDFFKVFALVLALLTWTQAEAQQSTPTLKLRCVGLTASSLKKAISGTIVDQAKLACPECKRIKAKVSLTYPKQDLIEKRADDLANSYELPAACSADSWQIGPVCVEPNSGKPKLVAGVVANSYVGASCQIADINARITLSYRDQLGKSASKQLSTVVDVGGILQ